MGEIKKRDIGKSGEVDEINIDAIAEYIKTTTDETIIYIGCDSKRYRKRGKWFADYALVVIIHHHKEITSVKDIDDPVGLGCKLFGSRITENDYGEIRTRLLREVELAIDLFQDVKEVAGGRHMEIHLDVNPEKEAGSNCVYIEAKGWVLGVLGIEAKTKPNAPAASTAADVAASKAIQIKGVT